MRKDCRYMNMIEQYRSGKMVIKTYHVRKPTGELMALLRLQVSANQRSLALTIFDVCMHGRRGNDLASLQAYLSYRDSQVNQRHHVMIRWLTQTVLCFRSVIHEAFG